MESRIERLHAICRSHGVDILYCFGSRSREVERFVQGSITYLEAGPSDCDVGAHVPSSRPFALAQKVALAQEMESFLGVDVVDLVLLNEADPFLACNVIRGERLLCVDKHQADEYELYILRRAGDLAPLERERQALIMESR